ncbi:hypothetical protein HX881_19450 [Pseudomonas gingeri]|uniref:Uncharacterized protein n=1 Tax=Pseudomonas gingeri TaxID=117681 RepID=A0A7Y8CGP8_9PSED|nr:hypothetical protein [Pseudomonas gingeri]NVZ27738.1 hypothetical protein [Pseudomonas gingeri]NWC17562.1 hypothetical protein [Pseudomonas gingeri]NWE46614.1 hypothetical protein [Pseudomonas gingeri]NWE70446.1 hypothetical protein [Pseudomonas gingeri]
MVGKKAGKAGSKAKVTFLEQNSPIDDYGRALYAVARSVIRAFIDSLSEEDLADINTPLDKVRLRQLAKIARLDRDKGMRGDGFEWAVHEAILGKEPKVINPISHALNRASTKILKDAAPTSLLFGQERAKYLGFLDAMVDEAGTESFLLPQGSGRPFRFGPWVSVAAEGYAAEERLTQRIKKIWKTDLFLSVEDDPRYFAATVKSNAMQLEGGQGLRIGIVPEHASTAYRKEVSFDESKGLWVVSLADPNGFMGLFNDGYSAVARSFLKMGKHEPANYWAIPSAKALKLMEQIIKYQDATALEVVEALNEAAQQDLLNANHKLVSVNAPHWLHVKKMQPTVISPKPKFVKLE